jgi:hypothetical protein
MSEAVGADRLSAWLRGADGSARLERERAGRYHLTPAPLSDAVSWIADVGRQWDERLAALARTLSS